MRSDTQLKEERPGPHNYVIDEAVSESWYMKGFFDNALSKEQEALKNIGSATFPSEEEKDVALAKIYQRLARIHSKLNDFTDMVAYEKGAAALGNEVKDEHYICWGYYKLKAYQAAVDACTTTINHDTRNLPAHYWRGAAYRQLDDPGAALGDLVIVADSEHDFRSSAAIDISMIYFGMKDLQKALDILNKYGFLYDANSQSRSNIAVAYNNRCYAYMELGDLNKALSECTASLRYGSLPDAYRKQQELLRRLSPYGALP